MPRILSWRQVCWLCLVCGVGIGTLGLGPVDAPPAEAQEKPPDRWTLPVEMRAQETEVWCWAATGQMTMEFLGKGVSQSEQANLAFRRSDCGQRPIPRACIRGGEILLGPYGFNYDLTKKPLSEAALVHQLYTLRKPVPFAWRFPGGGGHAALVVGYARQADGTLLVECLDPYPPPGKDARSVSGGHRVFMPYSRWDGDYDHAFGHALFNVTRKP
jgi:Papain-like cysteine protease AvrRpt2